MQMITIEMENGKQIKAELTPTLPRLQWKTLSSW